MEEETVNKGELVKRIVTEVKNHVERHKTKYYVGGLVVVAGVTFLVTRRVMLQQFIQLEGTNIVINKAVIKDGSLFKVFNIYSDGFKNQGPSWMVRCKETGVVFKSQEDAARNMGLSKEQLSAHLNDHRSNVEGYHFERIGVAA